MPEFFRHAILFQGDLGNEQILPLGSKERALARTLSWTDVIWKALSARKLPLAGNLQDSVIAQAEALGIPRETFPNRFDAMLDEWNEIGVLLNVDTLPVPSWSQLVG